MDYHERFAYNLKRLRLERGFTKRDFCKLAGWKNSATVLDHETKKSQSIPFESFNALCKNLNIDISELFKPIPEDEAIELMPVEDAAKPVVETFVPVIRAMTFAETIGNNIRRIRKEQKVSAEALKDLIGFKNVKSVLQIEHAEQHNMRFEIIEKFCEVFNISYEELVKPVELQDQLRGDCENAVSFFPILLDEVEEEEEWKDGLQLQVPKRLFHASRIEMRELIQEDGIYGRVDLFETPEEALRFCGGPPMDVYTIHAGNYFRKKIEVTKHSLYTLYSYHADIPTYRILEKATYRE